MIRKRIAIFLLGIVFPWVFLVFIVPLSALFVFNVMEGIIGRMAQIVAYIAALVVFILFLLLWYFLTMKYLRKMLSKYRGGE